MRPPTASEHIGAARAKLQLAIQLSGAADLAVLQNILEIMEATKSEMHLAEAAIRQGAPDERAQVRREAALLQRELGSMMRVVDGCAALHRGLSVQFGATSSSYTSQGRPVPAALISAACEMQG